MIQNNVLIVDDDKHICELISVILSKEGYHTVTARTGKEALAKLKEGYFDIALVDINMPDISGVQVLHSIKESSRETVVVMITGDASVETAVETLKGGAFDYITKPFEVDYLKETIKKAIESPRLNAFLHIIYVTDTNLRLIEANDAWDISAQVYSEEGLLFENIKGRKILDFYQDAEKTKYGKIYRELLDGTRWVYREEYECGSEGESRFFLQKIYPLTVDGNKTGLFFIHEDITQSKRDEEAFRKLHQEIVEANLKLQQTMKLLRISESKWRSMAENAPDIIMTVDCDGTILFINRTVPGFDTPSRQIGTGAATQPKGFTPEQTIGTSVYDYIPPEHHDRKTKSSVNEVNTIRESLGRVFQTGEADRKPKSSVSEANRYEIAGVGPHGATSWYESRVGAIKSNGQVESAVIITTDITERKQAEKKLEQYKLMVEAAHDAIFFKDLESRYIVANRKTLESFGLSRDEVIGKNDYELMPNREEAKKNVDDDQIVFNTGKPTEVTKHMTGSDGKEYWFQAIKVPQFDDKGNITGLVGIARDVTEQKQAEEEVRKLNEELEQRVIERTAELRVANKELEGFAYSVSHDLRAPLRSIDGFSQALLEDYGDKLDEDGQDYLHRVRVASQRMAQLIDDLLKLSRLTRGEMRHETLDLSQLAQAIAAELQQQAPDREVEFIIEEGLVASGDARLLRVVLENLLGNAWKYTSKHPHARIEFGFAQNNGETAYFVRDDGAGFDMAYADKLFGVFQRLHSEKEFDGTGIGLATVQRIIHRHGGRVWAEGAVEQGATFYFTL